MPGIKARYLFEGLKDHGQKNIYFCESIEEIPNFLLDLVQPGDLVLILGAGSIGKIADIFLQRLEELS